MAPGKSVPLSELASIIRSKNAGPFRITLDVLFSDPEKYQHVRDSGAVTREKVAAAYKVSPSEITSFFHVDMANAIKITLRRPRGQGNFGESDIYGCQQHVPLLGLGGASRMKISNQWTFILLGGPAAFMLAFFVLPFGIISLESVRSEQAGFTFANYEKALGDVYYWDTLLLTFKLSFFVIVIALLIGYPLAYFIVRHVRLQALPQPSLHHRDHALVHEQHCSRLRMDGAAGPAGPRQRYIALNRTHRYTAPASLRAVQHCDRPHLYHGSVHGSDHSGVLQNIDRSLEDASRDLGAGAWTTFTKVTLPFSLPGVIAGSLIVFTLSVSAYVTPSILSGGRQNVTSMLIFQQYGTIMNFQFGAALSIVLLATTLILVAAYLIALGRTRSGTQNAY